MGFGAGDGSWEWYSFLWVSERWADAGRGEGVPAAVRLAPRGGSGGGVCSGDREAMIWGVGRRYAGSSTTGVSLWHTPGDIPTDAKRQIRILKSSRHISPGPRTPGTNCPARSIPTDGSSTGPIAPSIPPPQHDPATAAPPCADGPSSSDAGPPRPASVLRGSRSPFHAVRLISPPLTTWTLTSTPHNVLSARALVSRPRTSVLNVLFRVR